MYIKIIIFIWGWVNMVIQIIVIALKSPIRWRRVGKRFKSKKERREYMERLSDRWCRITDFRIHRNDKNTERKISEIITKKSEESGIPQWEIRDQFEQEGIL